ncbi:SDR family oxidoreductase [Marinilabilia rubra]|uniref:Short-chain dehydrogenase n=1 Tax=Marinilabilia rubra TaxID=2162893 RepID=A0A2U2B6Q0_9BACT|nr:SDR family oxidoreductase [Marinilabilia rubra]PWD98751.1 short-chain dehydrogenase [Marinilabilia rubra]
MRKTAFVTGSAKRIGSAISEYLASSGWEVVLHYNHSRDDAAHLSEKLKQLYPDRLFPIFQCDLSVSDAVLSVFNRLPEGIEKIDALINNASIFDPGKIDETSLGFLRKQMMVNFEAPFLLMQAFKNHFGEGSVVNLLDTKIVKNEGTHAAYLLAKKNLAELTRMAALDFSPVIRVNGVAPGPVLPPPRKSSDYLKDVVEKTPLKKQVDVNDIAFSVYFLLNNPSVTGQVIFCDSGSHLV